MSIDSDTTKTACNLIAMIEAAPFLTEEIRGEIHKLLHLAYEAGRDDECECPRKEEPDVVAEARDAFTVACETYFAVEVTARTVGRDDPYPQDAALRTYRLALDAYRFLASEKEARDAD